MENQEVTTTASQAVAKPSGRTTDYGGFRPSAPSVARGKIVHPKGVFEITEIDGTKTVLDRLTDILVLDANPGRVMWDPNSDPGSGQWVCRSSNGDEPDPNGQYQGPCLSPQGRPACPMAQWGNKKVDPKGYKPKCSETLNLVIARKGRDPFWVSFDKGNLKIIKDFLTHSFFNYDKPFYAHYISIGLREEHFQNTSTIYQRLEPVLGSEPSRLVQDEARKTSLMIRGLAGGSPDAFTTTSKTVEDTPDTPSIVVEAQIIAAVSPADRIKTLSALAKDQGKTLSDVIKAAKAHFGQAPAQLSEGAYDLLRLAFLAGMEVPDLVAIGAEHVEIANVSNIAVEDVALIASLLDLTL